MPPKNEKNKVSVAAVEAPRNVKTGQLVRRMQTVILAVKHSINNLRKIIITKSLIE